MLAHHEFIQRYSGVRAYLDHMIAFAEAARDELGPDSPLVAQYDDACWMAEIRSYQQFACQRCGTFVSTDPFGAGAFMVAPYTRVCAPCYDDLTRSCTTGYRRRDRLAAYAHDHPATCAGFIVAMQRQLHMQDWQIDGYLGLDDGGVARLALCPRPRPDHADADITTLATVLGCSEEPLRRLFADTTQADADAGTGERRHTVDDALPFSSERD